jgi:cell division septal protein FtsQ
MLYRQVFFGVLLTLFIGAVSFCVWYVTRLPALTLTEVSVVGGETISHEAVRTAVEEELLGTYYRLIPKRFSYLYPDEAIEARLLRIPRLKEVAVERTSRQQLAVAFTEYVPHALWCAQPAAPVCLFIDRDGYAFAEAPRLEGGAYLRYVETGREPAVGQTVFTSTYVRETNAFVETLYDALRLPVTAVERDGESISYTLAGGGEIRTTTAEPLQTTLDNLQTLLASEEFSHLAPGNFQYIDLRFGNRVYVQETAPDAATTTPTTSAAEGE